MTRDETTIVLGILKTAYPKFYSDMTKNQANATIALWSEMFNDVPLNVVNVAVKKLIAELKFPPTVSDVMQQVAEVTHPNQKTAAEAWGEVMRAMRIYGYHRQEEAVASLSPATAKVVKCIGFRNLCTCEEPDVIRGQFRRMFEQVSQRERQEHLLPSGLKKQILDIAQNLAMIEGGVGE